MALDGGAPGRPPDVRPTLGRAFQGLFSTYEHKAFFGGRGSGKSHACATAIVIKSMQGKIRVACIRQFHNSLEGSSETLINDKIDQLNLRPWFRSIDGEITCLWTGATITFHGLDRNPASIKSLEGVDICWVEEAQSIHARAVEILTPTIRKHGAEIWWTWNPESPDDPVDALFRGKAPPINSLIREVCYTDNPCVDLTRMPNDMEAQRLRDFTRYQHIWLGAYRRITDSAVFKNWKVGRLDARGAEPLFGLDFGFAVDPTALVKAYLLDGNKKLYIAAEALQHELGTDALPQFMTRVSESNRYPIIADGSRPETIDYLNRHGFPMVAPAVKGPGSVEEGTTWLQGLDIIVDPDCVHTKRELENHSYKIDKRTGAVLPVLEDKFNHCIDAIRYAVENQRLNGNDSGFGFAKVKFGR